MTRSTTTPRRLLAASLLAGALSAPLAAAPAHALEASVPLGAEAPDVLDVTEEGMSLLDMAPGQVRVRTTTIHNGAALDAQVSTVASGSGELTGDGYVMVSVDACPVPWTDAATTGAQCPGEEISVLSDWAAAGTSEGASSFRVDSGDTAYLRTQVRLADETPQGMQGVRGTLSYVFVSVEAPPRGEVPAPGASPVPVAPPVELPVSAAEQVVAGPEISGEAPRGAVTGWLPRTGAQAGAYAGAAALLVVAGGLALALVRRRREGRAS